MTSMPGQLVSSPFGFLRLAGPILDKELRVMSRRRGLYVLRFVYICLFAAVVLRLWFTVWRSSLGGPAVLQVSRLGEIGRQIVALVVWFQFLTGQLFAALLLSDAIGKEVRQRTLDSLLVTPVGGLQIVLGKLLGRLLQAGSLVAISLPMLAVVRVFGGVPWDYVVAGLCLTLSAGLFAGALSLLCSTSSRDAYHAVLTVGLCYLVMWALVPMFLTLLPRVGYASGATVMTVLYLTNPFLVLAELTRGMTSGFGGVLMPAYSPCLILLALVVVVTAWSVWRVRRAALGVIPARAPETPPETTPCASSRAGPRSIRPVVGSPIVWKERCTPLFRARWHCWLSLGTLILVLGFVVAVSIYTGSERPILALFLVLVVQLLFAVDLGVAAASAVTKEKEARTWPVLLTTPLDSKEILRDKALGLFRRNLPLLMPLPVLYLLALLPDPSQQMGFWQVVVIGGLMTAGLVSTAGFLLGMGLYFSIRFRTTAAANVATLIAYVFSLFLFGGSLGPLLFLLAAILSRMGVHQSANAIPLATLAFALVAAGIYAGVGLLLLRLGAARVRRNVF